MDASRLTGASTFCVMKISYRGCSLLSLVFYDLRLVGLSGLGGDRHRDKSGTLIACGIKPAQPYVVQPL